MRGISKVRDILTGMGIYGLTGLLILLVAFPLYWMVTSSLKEPTDLFDWPPHIVPVAITFESYLKLVATTPFIRYFANSLVVAVATVAVVVTASTFGGYALSRTRFPGKEIFSHLILVTYMFPPILLVIPLFSLLIGLRLVDNYLALILTYPTITLPFNLWLMRAFFNTVPVEIEDAAVVDGATRFQAFYKVALPQARPGIITAGILAFVWSWNEFLYAAVFMSSGDLYTMPVGLANMSGRFAIDWGVLMAAATIFTIPALLLFIGVLKYMVRGFGAGALKG